MYKYTECADAGSEFCPCHLAETFDCIACSQLAGEDYCDCMWNGVCILNEYYNNMKKINEPRKKYEGDIVEVKNIGKNLNLIKIKTDKVLINGLKEIGAYVFIKGEKDKEYFETPMSVLRTEGDTYFYIIYQEIGCKSKKIREFSKVSIRGPFWNGILGRSNLNKIENANCLIIARGIGQSSILLPIEKLLSNGNSITLLLDKGKLDTLYIQDFIKTKDSIHIEEIDLFTDYAKKCLAKLLSENHYQLVLSAGSDMLHRMISGFLKEKNIDTYFLVSNNGVLCCGEGVCGSCITKTKEGNKVRLCKSKINPKLIY